MHLVIDSISLAKDQLKDKTFAKSLRSRIFTAVEQAALLSGGLIYLKLPDDSQILYSQNYSCPQCGFALEEIEPRMFSFNSPVGACMRCKGLGSLQKIDPKLILNLNLSISEGGVLPFSKLFYRDTWFSRLFETFLDRNGIDKKMQISKLSQKSIDLLLYGSKDLYRVSGKNRFGEDTSIKEVFAGVVGELEKRYYDSQSEYARYEIERFMNQEVCDLCEGKRLKKEILMIKIIDKNIFDYGELSIDDLIKTIDTDFKNISEYEKTVSSIIIKEISNRLNFLTNVGLGYLTINRSAGTLSGGESQRIRLASQIGSGLSGVIYVLDEPSIGLHSKDVHALITSLVHLKDLGNTIVVVEHDSDTIRAADHLVDFGPKAGKHGGKVVFSGTLEELKKADTLTSSYLFEKTIHLKRKDVAKRLSDKPKLSLYGAKQFNLKNITTTFPLGILTCVTGVSGSGKSTLVIETLYKALRYYIDGWHKGVMGEFEKLTGHEYVDKVYLVDQSPIGKTPRSNPATYIGVFDEVRDIFASTPDAKLRGYKKGRFSFNVKGGRCEKCQGAGTIKIEMQFLADVYVHCDVCNGKRYNSETLEVKYKDLSIYDVLHLTVDEAREFFSSFPAIVQKIQTLIDVGLGYIELGQPAPTLSGGEAQRIKLGHELSKRATGKTVYILDEPTTGLHMYDVEKLLHALYRLVDAGNTVIVIEHNLEFIENSEYVIDIGPDGGEKGGTVLFEGLLDDLYGHKTSYTAKYLRELRK
ncbi:MAG: excinuclease ABC subunit UvrA [Candidatus Roizmanbacteria bacterium]